MPRISPQQTGSTALASIIDNGSDKRRILILDPTNSTHSVQINSEKKNKPENETCARNGHQFSSLWGLYSSASQLLLSSNELYIIYAAVYDVGAHKSVHHLSGK